MNCPNCNQALTNDLASSERCGAYQVSAQPASRVAAPSAYRFEPYGRSQGSTAAPSATQVIPQPMAFSGMREPVGQPVLGVTVPNVSGSGAFAQTNTDHSQRRSRKARRLLCASLISALVLGFGGGMTAFALDDARSRMPIVPEYEETVTPDVSMVSFEEGDAEVVTIVDEPTPMASFSTTRTDISEFLVEAEPTPETDPAPAPLAGALEQAPIEEAPAPLAPYTLEINGTRVPYIHSVFATLCPDRNAALWAGSDDTTDGSFGYFIGHNPGDFACVYALVPGNYVTLCDANGNLRNYTVAQLYDIPNTTKFQELVRDVIPAGESLIMQTCIGDGSYYRIVVCL